jgi:hypothetical protein
LNDQRANKIVSLSIYHEMNVKSELVKDFREIK